jgi:hypothetical protein
LRIYHSAVVSDKLVATFRQGGGEWGGKQLAIDKVAFADENTVETARRVAAVLLRAGSMVTKNRTEDGEDLMGEIRNAFCKSMNNSGTNESTLTIERLSLQRHILQLKKLCFYLERELSGFDQLNAHSDVTLLSWQLSLLRRPSHWANIMLSQVCVRACAPVRSSDSIKPS